MKRINKDIELIVLSHWNIAICVFSEKPRFTAFKIYCIMKIDIFKNIIPQWYLKKIKQLIHFSASLFYFLFSFFFYLDALIICLHLKYFASVFLFRFQWNILSIFYPFKLYFLFYIASFSKQSILLANYFCVTTNKDYNTKC